MWLPKHKSATHESKKLPIFSIFNYNFLNIDVEFVANVDYAFRTEFKNKRILFCYELRL